MITPEDIRAGFDRGEIIWWTVSVYGRGQGVVLTEMRAVHRVLDAWDVRAARTLRVTATKAVPEANYAWPGIHGMRFQSPEDIEPLVHAGYASFYLAQEAAIASYADNSRVIAQSTQQHLDENNSTIEQLRAAVP